MSSVCLHEVKPDGFFLPDLQDGSARSGAQRVYWDCHHAHQSSVCGGWKSKDGKITSFSNSLSKSSELVAVIHPVRDQFWWRKKCWFIYKHDLWSNHRASRFHGGGMPARPPSLCMLFQADVTMAEQTAMNSWQSCGSFCGSFDKINCLWWTLGGDACGYQRLWWYYYDLVVVT